MHYYNTGTSNHFDKITPLTMHTVHRAGPKSEESDSNFIMNTVQVKLGKAT